MAGRKRARGGAGGEDAEEPANPPISADPKVQAAQLWQRGVVVIPVAEEHRGMTNDNFDRMLRQLPEFKPHSGPNYFNLRYGGKTRCVNPFVLGGFGALNVPSSLHHRDVRRWRQCCYDAARPLFEAFEGVRREASPGPASEVDEDYVSMPTRNFQMLFDRVCVRPASGSETLSPESWHRDQGPTTTEHDIFGGWAALDDQIFRCIPGTQMRGSATKALEFNKLKIDRFLREGKRIETIAVPANHIVLFHQNIVHEVARAPKRATDVRRLFTGFRLTPGTDDFLEYEARTINSLGAAPTPSGQPMPNYALLHWTNGLDKLVAWSKERLKPGLLVVRERKTGSRKGSYQVPPVSFLKGPLPSLRDMHTAGAIELDDEIFPEYSEEDRRIMLPHPLNSGTMD